MVEAGWFDDPEAPGALRWWDGTSWTEHRAPGTPLPLSPQSPLSPHASRPSRPRRRGGPLAWLALVAFTGVVGTSSFAGVRALAGDRATSIETVGPRSADDDRSDGEDPEAADPETADPDAGASTSAPDGTPATPTTGPVTPGLSTPAAPAWIAVLASVPNVEPVEVAFGRAAEHAAFVAGVFASDDLDADDALGPLTSGYWVVWTGPFAGPDEAQGFCDAQFGGDTNRCYPRHVIGR